MYTEILEQLGLAKNEAKIYEALLTYGQGTISKIATLSKIHRRNVYDSLDRLVDRGLAFEVIDGSRETRYQAAHPNGLKDILNQKLSKLAGFLPEMERLYRTSPKRNRVLVYRGVEGWKNYMRDILRVGADYYCIGGKGAWMEPRSMVMFEQFIRQLKVKKIKSYVIFDSTVKEHSHKITQHVGKNFKFFPHAYTSPGSVEIFGDHVCLLSDVKLGGFSEQFEFSVMINSQMAEAFRIWFKFIWDNIPR